MRTDWIQTYVSEAMRTPDSDDDRAVMAMWHTTPEAWVPGAEKPSDVLEATRRLDDRRVAAIERAGAEYQRALWMYQDHVRTMREYREDGIEVERAVWVQEGGRITALPYRETHLAPYLGWMP